MAAVTVRRCRTARLRDRLRERDGDSCYVCGLPIRRWFYTDPTPPDAATIEHVHELREGGTWARDNLALSHFRCNVERSRYTLFEKRASERVTSQRLLMPAWPALTCGEPR